MAEHPDAISHTASELIARRYQVEQRLAAGGMGEVFAVHDRSTGRRVALKRLLEAKDKGMVGMFEREYHTLVSLKHPRIVEVYEYGLDGDSPYYTMELLDGQDVRVLAPLPYYQACRYLRDVASSLALLHARRLLHRDVSPRNVRVTSDDRCKLLDFGALSSFGIMDSIVGTPPYLAPEAAQRAPLDQRADLFALGALAYWILTGKQAFPARTIRELPELWREPPLAPSAVARRSQSPGPIPRGLDELVLSLLSPDPLGRPSTAVEVIDRLNSLAALPDEHEALAARSYLHGAPTVGRSREQASLRRRMSRALEGAGASVVLEAPPGMGGTRLLSQLVLDAQLAGAVSIMVDADLHREVYGVAGALVEAVRGALPEDPYFADDATFASRLWPQVQLPGGGKDAPGPFPSGEVRGRTQHALASWLCAAASRRALVIAVDNTHLADEASAALLASLARLCCDYPLLLVTTRRPEPALASSSAMCRLAEASARIKVRPLSREHTQELLKAVFGGARFTERLAEWMYDRAGGNPQACMELVHHLVDSGVIRFRGGFWVLPRELVVEELPASVDNVLDVRLAGLSVEARRLAEALSTHQRPLSIDQCLAIAAREEVGKPHGALQELTREEVLTQSRTAYHFVHEWVRGRMYERLEPARRRALHRHLGRLLRQQPDLDDNGRLEAGWHLLHGGEEDEGAELLGNAAASLVSNTDELAAAVPALAAALVVFRKQKRSKRELIRLLAPLAMGGYRVDRALAAEYGEEAMRVFRNLIGLELADRLRPLVGKRLGVYLGLASGAIRSFVADGFKAPRRFVNLITQFVTTGTMLAGTAAICLDAARARFYCRCVESLASALGKRHPLAVGYDFMCTLARLPEDRCAEVTAGCQRVLARVEDATDPIHRQIPESSVSLHHGGAYYAMAAMAAFRDGPAALHYADKLEGLNLQLYSMAAAQVRVQYHANRGEVTEVNRHRRRLETLAIQAGSGWQVEVWSPCAMILAYHLTRDIIGIKGTVEELDRLRERVPSLQNYYQLALGVYEDLKGEPQNAHDIRRRRFDALGPRACIGWMAAMGDQAATLVALGRVQEAKELAEGALATMTEEDEPFIAMYQRLHTSLALAEATLGQYGEATRRLDDLIKKHRAAAGPVTMGNLHASRAHIAVMMNDLPEARAQLGRMERWFRTTDNPSLIAQCAHLSRVIDRACGKQFRSLQLDATGREESQKEVETARFVLSQCEGLKERAARALELVVAHAHGVGGYLYFYEPAEDRVELASRQHAEAAPAELQDAVLEAIHEARKAYPEDTAEVAEFSTEDSGTLSNVDGPSSVYRVFPLIGFQGSGAAGVLGAVAVIAGSSPVNRPSTQVLEAIARLLLDDRRQERITLRPRRRLGRRSN